MPVTTPELIWLMASEVLDCVCEALDDQGACGCPCRAIVTLGQPAWDDCCNGQLAVWNERVYISNAFPATETQEIICTSQLAGDFSLQLIRCAPTIDDNGNPPTPEQLNNSSAQILQDMYVAERAVICCLAQYKKYRRFTMRDARTVGPQGGCVGFEIKWSVEIADPIPVV